MVSCDLPFSFLIWWTLLKRELALSTMLDGTLRRSAIVRIRAKAFSRARSLLEWLLLVNLLMAPVAAPFGGQMRVERPEPSSKEFSAPPTLDLSFSSENDLIADI
jgi:hypothetical protein